MSETKPAKLSAVERLKGKLGLGRPERSKEMWTRFHKEGGMIPLLNFDDVETRRQKIEEIMTECSEAIFDRDLQKKVVAKVYKLLVIAGVPWIRGLDNPKIMRKVALFKTQIKVFGHYESYLPDLFEEAQVLLALSWKALDVTNTPAVFIESRPVIIAGKGGEQVQGQLDTSGLLEMQRELERLKTEREQQQ